jgi:outer membrane protein TolC
MNNGTRDSGLGTRGLLLVALVVGARSLGAQQERIQLTLQQAVELAEKQGFAARSATSARDAARWRDRAFGARLLPQLSVGGEVPNISRAIIPVIQPDGSTLFVPQSQTQSTMNLRLSQRIPGTGGSFFVSSNLTRVDRYGGGQNESRLWSSTPVTIGVQQDIFRPNSLAWDSREQDLRATSADRVFLEAREDVAVNTANAFFDFYAAKVALQNAANNAAVNDTLYTLSKGRFEVGKIGENDLLQSELALLRSRNALDGAKLEFERTLGALRLLINVPTTAIEIVSPTGTPLTDVDTARAVKEALNNRSQMTDFELQAVQAKRRLTEARLNTGFGATLSATAGYNQRAEVFGDAYRSLQDQQTLRLTVDMPLVQWGGRKAQIEAARADQDRVASSTRAGRDQLAHEALFAALQLGQSARQLTTAAKADTVGAKRFEVAKNRYVIGKIGIDNLYQAQNEKDQAVNAYVDSLRRYWTAFYRLRRLTLYDFVEGREIR